MLEVLNWTAEHFEAKGFENARLNAEQLLAYVLGVQRVGLYLKYDRPLTVEEKASFKDCVQRRLRHEPLQYIVGTTEFMSLPFRVTPAVLIPRPETEVLVERAVAFCQQQLAASDSIRCLDIGTGSGNIAISLAQYVPKAQVTAVDSSEDALAVARDNAHRLDVQNRVTLKRLSIFDSDFQARVDELFHLVLSNPPYITRQDLQILPPEIKDYEPIEALDGGEDGLDFYRRLVEFLPALLLSGGAVLLEIGEHQGEAVSSYLSKAKLTEFEIVKDLSGRDRAVFGIWRG